ncbi:MAG: hypothetical protein M5U34_04385 [Chloroflexi bacterium]|nr:hypothetical protein [Chloroflexota bacterium]
MDGVEVTFGVLVLVLVAVNDNVFAVGSGVDIGVTVDLMLSDGIGIDSVVADIAA